jgi:hypothetical protein
VRRVSLAILAINIAAKHTYASTLSFVDSYSSVFAVRFLLGFVEGECDGCLVCQS